MQGERPKITVLRHEPFEHLGYFAEILEEREIPFEYCDLGQPLPNATGPLIVMGGPQSANDLELQGEVKLIEHAIAAGTPVLGICLGAQLIAKALGTRVYMNPELEIGWEAVHLTGDAQGDPVFGRMPSPSTFFHWHGETFDLPTNAKWLAYSDKTKYQAFCCGVNVYGIQFHPEITPEMIVDWCGQPVNCGDVQGLNHPVDAQACETAALARTLLQGWLGAAEI
jgi:GMP synthase (glutamine-hydrolysing)